MTRALKNRIKKTRVSRVANRCPKQKTTKNYLELNTDHIIPRRHFIVHVCMREPKQLLCSLILSSLLGHGVLVCVLSNYGAIQNTSATGEAGQSYITMKVKFKQWNN